MPIIRQEINILTGTATSSTAQTNHSAQVSLDPSLYNGSMTYYYEIMAMNTNTTTNYNVRLANGSFQDVQIQVNANTNSYVRLRSSSFTPTSISNSYSVGLPGTASASQVSVKMARVVVVQDTGSYPVVSTETQIEIGNQESQTINNVNTPLTNPKYWHYDSANWDGVTTFYTEITGCRDSSTMGDSTWLLEQDDGSYANWSSVATIASAITSLTPTKYRTTFTPTSGRNYRIASKDSSNKWGGHTTYNAKVIVRSEGSSTTYYFDGNDAVTDNNGTWTNDATAFDSDEATYASSGAATAADWLRGEGTTAPTTGAVYGVATRVKASRSATTSAQGLEFLVYSDGQAQTLLSKTYGDTIFSATLTWMEWNYLAVPSGGWTMNKVNLLESRFRATTTPHTVSIRVAKAEVKVYTGTVTKVETQYLLMNTAASSSGLKGYPTVFDANEWSGVENVYKFSMDSGNASNETLLQESPYYGHGFEEALGQSFKPTVSGNINKIDLVMYKSGNPTDYVFIELHSYSQVGPLLGTSGNQSPSGLSAFPTSGTLTFTFSPTVAVTANTTYYMVVKRTGTRDQSNYASWKMDAVYANGVDSYREDGVWYDGTSWDHNFIVYLSDVANVSVSGGAAADHIYGGTPVAGSAITGINQVSSSAITLTDDVEVDTEIYIAAGTVYATRIVAQVNVLNPLLTITLDEPGNGTTISNTTPALKFTGTDANSNLLEYRLQLDSSNYYISPLIDDTSLASPAAFGVSTTATKKIENQSGDGWSDLASTIYKGIGQSFTVGPYGMQLTMVRYVSQYYWGYGPPTPAVTIRCKVYTASGDAPNALLSTSATTYSTDNIIRADSGLSPNYSVLEFNFSQLLAANTKYVFVVVLDSTISGTYLEGLTNSTSSYSGGCLGRWTSSDSYTTQSTSESYFELWGTDGGLFDSGTQVTYTVQSALSAGTYYWHVRARDPSGSNAWSGYTSSYSFTISGRRRNFPLWI